MFKKCSRFFKKFLEISNLFYKFQDISIIFKTFIKKNLSKCDHFRPNEDISVQMESYYQKHGQNPDFDFQNIFISKIILKFENRICSILHCPTRFEMSQLARTSQLPKREIHVRNRETRIEHEKRERRREKRKSKLLYPGG